MKMLSIVLPDSTHTTISNLAQKKGVDAAQYCSALLSELAEEEQTSGSHRSEKHADMGQNGQITEVDLIREILAFLKQKGGANPKVAVEQALFGKFNEAFKTPYYLELVGGGIPRWKKNVQFARNTARNIGLIKPPEESGRGNWELTEKGRQWRFD